MDEITRSVAWAIAEAWWRKRNRVAAGAVPEANSSTEYADNFWQGWVPEARCAIEAMQQPKPDAACTPIRSASSPSPFRPPDGSARSPGRRSNEADGNQWRRMGPRACSRESAA